MVNRYDNPAQAQFMNTYVPIPFEQLYNLGREANARVDKAMADYSSTLDKWSDFKSQSNKDMQTWYDETIGKAKPVIEKMAGNLDMIKTPEGRMQLYSVINNVDRAKLSALKQSAANFEAYNKTRQDLIARGMYNPLWHDRNFSAYDTTTQGLYTDLSPLAYKSVNDLVNPYVDDLKPSEMGKSGNYLMHGVSKERTRAQVDKNISNILSTPEAAKHIETNMRMGLNAEDARNKFIKEVYTAAEEKAWSDRAGVDQFALEDYKRRLRDKEKEQSVKNMFTDKLTVSFLDKEISQGNIKYNSQYERFRKTFEPGSKWNKQYVDRTTEDGKKITKPRYQSARDVTNMLFQPIGSQATFINNAELDPKTAINGLNGQRIYNMSGKPGFNTIESFVNKKMGVGINQSGWNADQAKFNRDLENGVIPNIGTTPTDRVAMTGGGGDGGNFTQEYVTYIPVSYFRKNLDGFKDADTDKDLLENKDFQNFLSKLNGKPVGTTGSVIARKSMKVTGDDLNAAYEARETGIFSPDQYDISQPYDGAYVEIPTIKTVLSNQQTRERANIEEVLYQKIGSKNNYGMSEQIEQNIYGQ